MANDRAELARRELARRELERRSQQPQEPAQQKQAPQENPLQQLVGGIGQPVTNMQNTASQGAEFAMNQVPAGLRSAVMGQGFQQGFNQPNQVPTFSDEVSRLLPMTGQNLGEVALEATQKIPMYIGAQILDELTNPVGLALSAAGVYGTLKHGGQIAKKVGANAKKFTTIESNLQQARKSKAALDAIRDTLGKAKEIAIQEVGDVATDLRFPKTGFASTSGKVVNALKNPVYEITFDQQGLPIQTVKNLDKVKEAIGDLIHTPKLWEEAGSKEIQVAKQFYGQVVGAMKTAARKAGKPIDNVLESYSKFMEHYRNVNDSLVGKYQQVVSKKIKQAFTIGAEDVIKESWKEVAKSDPTIKSVMGSMQRRNLLRNMLRLPFRAKEGF